MVSKICISFLLSIIFIHPLFSQDLKRDADKNKISNLFPNAEKYKIIYLQKGNLWVMNENGKNKKQITKSDKIIAFTCDRNVVYYSQANGLNLDVFSFILGVSGLLIK